MPETAAAPLLATLSESGLDQIAAFLLAGTKEEADDLAPTALQLLAAEFPAGDWGMDHDSNLFGHGALRNLYEREIPSDFRAWLTAQGIDGDQYAAAIRPIQFNFINIWPAKLFPAAARANRGWRIRFVGFPNLNTIAAGLASHYQGNQSQNEIGRASALIHHAAFHVLKGSPEQQRLEAYPAATVEHWDGRGLMPQPIHQVGGLDISSFRPEGAQLKVARNTTVKKDLASFFAVIGLPRETFVAEGNQHITALRAMAAALGEVES